MQSIYELYVGLYVHQLIFLFLDTRRCACLLASY